MCSRHPDYNLLRTAFSIVVAISNARSASLLVISVPPYLPVSAYSDNVSRSDSDTSFSHSGGRSPASVVRLCIHLGSVPDAVMAAFMAFSAACWEWKARSFWCVAVCLMTSQWRWQDHILPVSYMTLRLHPYNITPCRFTAYGRLPMSFTKLSQ